MNDLRLFVVLSVCVASGCTHAEKERPATAAEELRVRSPPPDGKMTAPVTIDFAVTTERAVVTVTSARDAEAVRVDVTGTDGLGLEPATAEPGPLKAGQPLTLTVPLSLPRGVLVVAVEGVFSGARLSRVASLEVGRPRPAGPSGPTVIDTADGPVRVVPVDR